MYKFGIQLLFLLSILGRSAVFAQDSVYSGYRKILPEDFHPTSPVVDSNSAVVVLADIGNAEMEGYENGWRVKYTRYRKLLIRNKNGYTAAKIELSFDPGRNGEGKIASLRANTYNLENGKIIPRSVDTADMYLGDGKDGQSVERFTFPDVREGSVIEYTYSIFSGSMYYFHSWDFQGDYPRVRSEYAVTFPSTFNYAVNKQGQLSWTRSRDSLEKKVVVGRFTVKTMFYTVRWTMKDVPAMVEEPFVSSIDNYAAGIRFQLSEYTRLDTRRRIKVTPTWKDLNEDLYKDKSFGGVMTASTHFLRKELRMIVEDSASDLDKSKELFTFVRDHFTTRGRELLSDDDRTVKEIFKARKGTVEEINLMLTAMLRDEGLSADAVLLSTRDNGLINPYYPLTDNFNYVVVRLRIGNKIYFLDATQPQMGFGRLPLECYNGYARVVSEKPDSVILTPDSISEFKFTSVRLSNNDAGDGFTGSYTSTPGYYTSMDIREDAIRDGENAYFDAEKKSYPFDVKLTDKKIDSIKSHDQPVTIHYSLDFPTGGEDRIYFSPMLSEARKSNPFLAATRQYPVEMPFGFDELYVLQMDNPKGYEVEEVPKPTKVKLGDDGSYEYGFYSDDNSIQFRSRLILKRAYYQPDEYQFLRDFFALVVKKQSEVIVFRKKK